MSGGLKKPVTGKDSTVPVRLISPSALRFGKGIYEDHHDVVHLSDPLRLRIGFNHLTAFWRRLSEWHRQYYRAVSLTLLRKKSAQVALRRPFFAFPFLLLVPTNRQLWRV